MGLNVQKILETDMTNTFVSFCGRKCFRCDHVTFLCHFTNFAWDPCGEILQKNMCVAMMTTTEMYM